MLSREQKEKSRDFLRAIATISLALVCMTLLVWLTQLADQFYSLAAI